MWPQLRRAQDLQTYPASFSNRTKETGLTKSPESVVVCLGVLCFSFWNILFLLNVLWASYHLMTIFCHKSYCQFPTIKHNNMTWELSKWKRHFCHLLWDPRLIFDSALKIFAAFEVSVLVESKRQCCDRLKISCSLLCIARYVKYNNINSQLDATIIVLLIISIILTCFGR